ncbi:LANO_0B02476g1_1 [Lachancea nothofagi CBS 11611]|uniref:LANO_0B02476g1_1 n=1 Tax=Lachancea nothofagi CBS 11611 TaxID=1266666 RepID=A0A1G4IW17_9SACH|nr:LANO_0B02476g1_1 [Lachancea nothofagi CBS 11611]
MASLETSSSSPFLRKREYGNKQPSASAEERVFGPRIESRFMSTKERQISLAGVLLSACAVVVTAGLMFLLGVNIVIQYRTMVPEDRSGLLRKACYIVLSATGIFFMNKFNQWFYQKMMTYFSDSKYQRLPAEESFEMRSRA